MVEKKYERLEDHYLRDVMQFILPMLNPQTHLIWKLLTPQDNIASMNAQDTDDTQHSH